MPNNDDFLWHKKSEPFGSLYILIAKKFLVVEMVQEYNFTFVGRFTCTFNL